MKGDFTRSSFRVEQHYHGVLKQQGRVDLDSDWNEQGAITTHRIETEALDVIGAAGAPQANPGFMLKSVDSGSRKNANLSISAGRAYVDGILCENEQDILITAQPDLPGFQLPSAAGAYLAYLEVWERHITSLDDPEILEPALGGPDTCTRARTVWQVKLLQASAGADCSTSISDYDKLIAPSTGTLKAQAQPTKTTDPCMVPATAGFRSLENQLYRVEIHKAGTGDAVAGSGTATFKWSRDNGSVVASWIAPPSGQNPGPNTLFVNTTGKDSVLGFASGQWVELSDDTRELNFQPGTLVQLTNVQGQVLTVDPSTVIPAGASLNLADYKLNPKIRRWDSIGATAATTASFLDLENGVQVQFASGTYNTGDYWLIPARTLTANIDWPVDSSSKPLAEPPKGVRRHYCRLAIVQFDGKVWSVNIPSCLPIFPPLTGLNEKGIHITDVHLLSPDVRLANDSEVSIAQIFQEFGINIFTDAPVDPVSARPTTCFVTVDVPYPLKDVVAGLFANALNSSTGILGNLDTLRARLAAGPAGAAGFAQLPNLGYQPLILPGKVTAKTTGTGASAANQISWTPDDAGRFKITELLAIFLELMPALQPTSRLLTHLTLKGDFIWGANDPTLYLDGEAFGIRDGSHIALKLPESGNGKRGGDFEMWFFLVLPVTLVPPIQLSTNAVTVSSAGPPPPPVTGTLKLVGTQLTAGNSVALSAQFLDPAGKPLKGTVTITPPSITLGTDPAPTFQLTGITLPNFPAGAAAATLRVTATYGTQTVTADLTINKGA